jgi:pimeloyl-ACP methyl ester carboxylesterase
MAYVDAGEGPAILLVHGVPTSSWLYRKMIPGLVRAGYRVIAPDLLGYGNSEKRDIAHTGYDPPAQGKRLLQLMDSLGVSSWTHVCHDAGGPWSFEMLGMDPKRVDRLVLLNTIVFAEGFEPPMTFRRGHWLGKAYVSLYRSKAFCKTMINGTLDNGMKNCDLSRREMRGYWKPMSEGTSKALYSFFTSFDYLFTNLSRYQDILQKSGVPAMICWGEEDEILDGKKQVPLISKLMKISDKDIHLIKGTKHFVQEEVPEMLIKYISKFERKKK